MAIEILSFPEADVPPDLRRAVLALHEQAWPRDPSRPRTQGVGATTHDPALHPVSLILVETDHPDLPDGTRVHAALDILSTEIEHAGERWEVSGLSTVVTAEAERGKGYARQLATVARNAMQLVGVDVGLFTCDREIRRVYESAGWAVLPGAVLVGGTREQPFPSDQFDKVTLGAFLSERAQARAAAFEHCRIELFPGPIDRLW